MYYNYTETTLATKILFLLEKPIVTIVLKEGWTEAFLVIYDIPWYSMRFKIHIDECCRLSYKKYIVYQVCLESRNR